MWIQLPDTVSVVTLGAAAAARKVLVGSGAAFFPAKQGYPALRLNFSLPLEATERGIRVLGKLLYDLSKR